MHLDRAGHPIAVGQARGIQVALLFQFLAHRSHQLRRRLGRKVVELPLAQNFDDIRANIRLVAAEIGERDAGEALIASDFAPVQGFVLVMAIMYVLLNLMIDLLYGVIDPRVRMAA